MKNENWYYLAGPGFTEQQLDRIHQVENMFDKMEVEYYSPFKKGNRLDTNVDPELLKLNVQLIFDENLDCLRKCSKVVALVDDLDKGTLFEIGYFVAALVDCEVRLSEINQRLLLLGKHASEISEWIIDLIEKSKSKGKKNDSEVRKLDFYLQDLNEKVEKDYLTMGWMYYFGTAIITYSEKELDSNVMTACSTFNHVIGDRNAALAVGKNKKLVKDRLFNLNPFKFFKKID